jgi:hypothetical protein
VLLFCSSVAFAKHPFHSTSFPSKNGITKQEGQVCSSLAQPFSFGRHSTPDISFCSGIEGQSRIRTTLSPPVTSLASHLFYTATQTRAKECRPRCCVKLPISSLNAKLPVIFLTPGMVLAMSTAGGASDGFLKYLPNDSSLAQAVDNSALIHWR